MTKALTEKHSVIVERDAKTGELISEQWYDLTTSKLHRTDGPAVTEFFFDPEGEICQVQEYFTHGEQQRDGDLPALVVTNKTNDIVTMCQWFENGELGRPGNKPAYIKKDPTSGVVVREEYRRNGQLHREYGPAIITRNSITGEIDSTSTYRFGVEMMQQNDSSPEPS